MNIAEIEKRKQAILDCRTDYHIPENPAITDEVLASQNFPNRSLKILAVLILTYKRKATDTELQRISTQPAALVRDLRERGFVFRDNGNKNNPYYLFRDEKGQTCREIIGFGSARIVKGDRKIPSSKDELRDFDEVAVTNLMRVIASSNNSELLLDLFQQIAANLQDVGSEEVKDKLLDILKRRNLTKEDINLITGRKDSLEIFQEQLNNLDNSDWTESKWQEFFEKNTWIFGYGLDYRFLKILQREARVSRIDVDGKNTVITDFLLASTHFTVLVELKKPTTLLFGEKLNRSDSWKLSDNLINAVSQILSQKANWLIKAETPNYTDSGELITQQTYDPKAILIIGHTREFKGDDRDSRIKSKTFELFRRNYKDIEMITYDELLERAVFIVTHKSAVT